MSDKFFYKGRKQKKPKHESYGYNTKRSAKAGSQTNPLKLTVPDEERKAEVQAILLEHDLVGQIKVEASAQENILELEAILNKPQTQTFEKQPNRNEPCTCGSGKKYKKCCGQ
ncbi:PBPRA1643 family SWIM/SEC-C metal-binding motif protein [Dongshaea marina]|uniref:PBPRA1643 family SWIM/SEC-C metal-binding motif protein n=1 Tax=Dongshaea marina TaxID=2047966 RepID=UPI000D3E0A32|nr:PBPRA1643 family SWIM/SEC-C metal-binding motif protein [Dongshaea marina]